jgi:heme/copper-type cytochrome/quinol oxidase subunit 2
VSNPMIEARRQATQPQSSATQNPTPGGSAAAGPPAVIHMTAQKYHFDPSPVHVKSGSQVKLFIQAEDRAHGFSINTYPDKAAAKEAPGLVFADPEKCWRIEMGKETEIDFVAKEAGTYAFKCCNFCGLGHLGMKGELIVDP